MFVIAGVTGNTGSVVASTLLEQGKKVRVVVRDAAKGEPWKARGAEVAVAALDDVAALSKALEGASGAYLLSPPDLGAKDFLAEKKVFVDRLAQAVEASGVPHVVFLSSVGGQQPKGTGVILSVHEGEARLAKTRAKLTFIRAAYFLENWASVLGAAAQGTLPTFLPAELRVPMVGTRDIGLVAARALAEGPPAEKVDIVELAGPADYSANDIAAAASKIFGKPVRAEGAPLDAVVPTFTSFGISPSVAALMRELYQGVIDGTVAFEGGRARFVRGRDDAETVLRGLAQG